MASAPFSFDTIDGMLSVRTSGFWTEADADRYLIELARLCREARVRHGRALVLVDGREAAVQRAAVMDRLANIAEVLLRAPDDRAAYVVTAAIGGLQARRVGTSSRMQVFDTIDHAAAWLKQDGDAS